MAGKKKKEAAVKAALEVQRHQKELKQRFIQRIKDLLAFYGGSDLLTNIPPIFIEKLFELRYPVLKGKPAPGFTIAKEKIVVFNKLMNQFMENEWIELENGNKFPLSWHSSEGTTLIDSITEITPDHPSYGGVVPFFEPYFEDSKHYREIQDRLASIVLDSTRFLSDLMDTIIKVDFTQAAVFNRFQPKNDLLIHAYKPEVVSLHINGEKHSAIQLGWVNNEMKWHMLKVKPSQLGFKVEGLDIPLDIFIQTHALRRLKERINIIPGVMHEILFHIFAEDRIKHVFKNGQSLVEYYVSDLKVGYFLVRLHSNQLVIHTFLFLTNDRTPEGDKLKRLLDVEKEDKKYLEIDNLPSFNAYRFWENEKLSKLFTEAGCSSLLKLGHLKEFSEIEVSDKDPESITHYLADAPFFRTTT